MGGQHMRNACAAAAIEYSEPAPQNFDRNFLSARWSWFWVYPLGLRPVRAPRSTMARPAPILYQSVLALPSRQRGNKMTLPKARPCLRSPKGLRVGKLPSKGAEAGAGRGEATARQGKG